MRSVILSLFGAAALFCSSPFANAVTIYGTTGGGGGPSTLYTIDPNTGVATPVGTGIGFDRVGAIDFDPTGTTLYGIGANTTTGNFQLITIDTMTGMGTAVGDIEGSNTAPNFAFQDINFRSDGTLFGFGGANIYTFNLATGAATLVGFYGHAIGKGNGLAFDASNTLYLVDGPNGTDIFTISQTDGFGTDTGRDVIYPVEIGTNPRTNAMDYDLTTGTLYASVVHSVEHGTPTNFIAEIDLATGAVSNPKLTITDLDGLAVLAEQPTPPPTNGVPESMSTLWLGLGLMGLFAFRRFSCA